MLARSERPSVGGSVGDVLYIAVTADWRIGYAWILWDIIGYSGIYGALCFFGGSELRRKEGVTRIRRSHHRLRLNEILAVLDARLRELIKTQDFFQDLERDSARTKIKT